MRCDKTKPILGVDLRSYGRDLAEGGCGGWIEGFLANALHVGGDSVGAVGIHAAEVSCDETFCDYGGVVGGCVVCDEDLGDEGLEVGWFDIVHLLLLLLLGGVGHGGCFVLEIQLLLGLGFRLCQELRDIWVILESKLF